MLKLHSETNCFTSNAAQAKFCNELSNEEYPFNLHLYNVNKTKDELSSVICLGFSPRGVSVFDVRRGSDEISLITTFTWSSITKINADVIY